MAMASRAMTSRIALRCACASTSAPTARLFSSTARRFEEERFGSSDNTPLSAGRTAQQADSSQAYQRKALDDLSSSIEQLSQRSAPGSGKVFTPRSPGAATRNNRQAVSGRAFLNGHYYNPNTLSYDSITERRRRSARPILGPTKKEAVRHDLLHIHSLNPGKPSLHDDSYKNVPIISNFMSEMGKILPRAQTGLTRKSQRSVGKAIRRARAIGLVPVLSRGQGPRYGGSGWK